MRHRYLTILACLLWGSICTEEAQPAPTSTDPVKLGMILDMGSLYADVTGPGSELAARMAVAADRGNRG